MPLIASKSLQRLARIHLPVLDFLVPSLTQTSRPLRHITTSQRASSTSSTSSPQSPIAKDGPEATPTPTPIATFTSATNHAPPSLKPLTQAQRDFLTSALRVNQAGELAATLIYTSQTPPLVTSHPHLRPLLQHMHAQEAGHFATFNALLARHRVRPTLLYPVWTGAASLLGWGTAVLGREAAMACTEAVETEIGEHYNGQVRVLLDMVARMEADGEEVGEELRELVRTIRKIRDEELEHLDYAVENDAKEAVPHVLLTNVIRAGCRGAIWVSERV